jgi:asparagine N-glycosylation enzyme membrane subunit Stt3
VPRQQQELGPTTEPVHYRSRAIAIILAILAFTYVPLSLHNFYLGYYGRGALAIAVLLVASSLAVLGLFGGLNGGIAFVGAIGIAMLAGYFIWQFTDLIRICTRSLKPKNGEYR